jgi:adenylate cyclase
MDRLDGLALWLADHEQLAVQELHIGFCGELVARGIPLWRSGLGLELLHPEQSGERSIWRADGSSVLTQAPAGVASSDDYLNSPVRIVDDTDRPFRQRLDDSMPRLPLLEDMRREGGTDYVIYPLPFLDRTRSAYLSFATQAAEGFSESDIGLLETSARLLSPYAERRALRRIAVDLLDTYVGPRTGQRIIEGRVDRGAVELIEAAI